MLNSYVLTSLLAPITGAVISGIFGRFLGRRGSILITTNGLLLAFLVS